ncbi:MAG: phosphotransferase [Arachnia sp.]
MSESRTDDDAARWADMFPGVEWRVDEGLSRSLHSLNNHVTVLVDAATGERFVARVPNAATAGALGVRRDEELRAIDAACAAGLTPAPRSVTADGALLTPFVDAVGDWAPGGWVSDRGLALLRRLLDCPAPDNLPSTTQRIERMLGAVRSPQAFGIDAPAVASTLAAIGDERARDRRYPACLAHLDLWANNVIDAGDRLWIVDFEFASAGDGWVDLAIVTADAGLDDDGRAALLRAVGRRGDAEDLRALGQGRWLFHAFEMLWGALMAEQGEAREHQGGTFDYGAHARRVAADLDGLIHNFDLG